VPDTPLTPPTTYDYDLNRDGIPRLGLPYDLEGRLQEAISELPERPHLVEALNGAITEQVRQNGVDGDWFAEDIVRAVLEVAEVTDVLAARIHAITRVLGSDDVGLEFSHTALNPEGVTELTLTVLGEECEGSPVVGRCNLPADPEDPRVFWVACRAAGHYVWRWLRMHGVPVAVVLGTGWSVGFTRGEWS
jgi:hypothetical protein